MKTTIILKLTVTFLAFFGIVSLCNAQIPSDYIFWHFSSGAYYNEPVIKDSVMYCGSLDSCLYAISPKTGKKIWQYKSACYITSTPAIQDSIVCFEAGNKLYGLQIKTGKLLWLYVASASSPSLGQATNYHHSSPLIYNNVAYFGDESGNMNGISITTGKLVFKYQIKTTYTNLNNYNIRTKPAIKDNIIYFGDYGKNVYAISLTDSTEKWIHTMASPKWDGSLVSEVTLHDSSIYIGGYNNTFTPLDSKTGSARWSFVDTNTFLPSTPIFYNNNIIIGTTINSNKIYCLNSQNGKVVWSLKVKGIFFNKPLIIRDSILVMNSTEPFGDNIGVMYFINCKNGTIINQLFLNGASESYPKITGDTLIIGKDDGLYAINYLPYLKPNLVSNIKFNDSSELVSYNKDVALQKIYPITNQSNFCDSLTITYSVDGDASKSNMSLIVYDHQLIKPSEVLKIGFAASANKLMPGNYTILFKIYSYHNHNAVLYEKNIVLTINDASNVSVGEKSDEVHVFPNPFNSEVTFKSGIFSESNTCLSIYTLQGVLIYRNTMKNNTTVSWNGKNLSNLNVANGIYVYIIETNKKKIKGTLIKGS